MALRKIGSNLNVKGMVIHQLNKSAGNRSVIFKKARRVLNIQQKEKLFLGQLNESYRKKSNPTYGIFGDTNPNFKNLVSEYLNTDKFYNFSVDAAKEYKRKLENTISATGGFLIFTDFINTDNSNRYLLILTTKNKDGFVVSEDDLTLKDIKNLDLSKVDVACMINLTVWLNVESGIDVESQTYLSFVKGNKNISYYFMSFIDCDNKTTSTESSRRLKKAIDSYATDKGYERKDKIRIKNIAFDHCISCLKEKKEIKLSALSALIDPDNPTDFLEFASSEEYGVSETIRGNKRELQRIKYIKYDDEKYKIEFDSNLLGKEVVFNKNKNELTFKNIPTELANQIP